MLGLETVAGLEFRLKIHSCQLVGTRWWSGAYPNKIIFVYFIYGIKVMYTILKDGIPHEVDVIKN